MREQPSVASVVGVVGAQDGMDAVRSGGHPQRVLGEIRAALMVRVDVLPGLRVAEGHFVGSDADGVAVAVVKLLGALHERAAEEDDDVG